MSIDFFIAPCSKPNGNCKKEAVVCKTITRSMRFGVSDGNSDRREPAFLDFNDTSNWDLTVNNLSEKEITFKAIDFCVEIYRIENELIKRCEGFLFYENKILFIEVKNSMAGRWLIHAREKFEETILKFREAYPDNNFEILEPVLANRIFYRTHQNEMVQKKILKDRIGIEFHIRQEINIV